MQKKVMILLAGYPGTGKSYLCGNIMKMVKHMVMISQDELKEVMFDFYGYDDLSEKERLINISWKHYYSIMEKNMKEGRYIISDYPFSQKQYPTLKKLSAQYGYQVLTIRMKADLDILYKRQQKRDLDITRHLSHIVSHYHFGDTLDDRSQADCLLSYDEFIKRCTTRGYGEFVLGDLIEVDVSDFTRVDYPGLLAEIKTYL